MCLATSFGAGGVREPLTPAFDPRTRSPMSYELGKWNEAKGLSESTYPLFGVAAPML